MMREEQIRALAEKAKGQTVDCESAYYECDGMCSPDACIGHENGWAEFNGAGGEGELQIELGQLLAACEPAIIVALCDIAASARRQNARATTCCTFMGDFSEWCADCVALHDALARFDKLRTRAEQYLLDRDDNTR